MSERISHSGRRAVHGGATGGRTPHHRVGRGRRQAFPGARWPILRGWVLGTPSMKLGGVGGVMKKFTSTYTFMINQCPKIWRKKLVCANWSGFVRAIIHNIHFSLGRPHGAGFRFIVASSDERVRRLQPPGSHCLGEDDQIVEQQGTVRVQGTVEYDDVT